MMRSFCTGDILRQNVFEEFRRWLNFLAGVKYLGKQRGLQFVVVFNSMRITIRTISTCTIIQRQIRKQRIKTIVDYNIYFKCYYGVLIQLNADIKKKRKKKHKFRRNYTLLFHTL